MRALARAVLLVVSWATLWAGCATKEAPVVLHRSGCRVCHEPLNEDGVPHGIEEAHPWHPLECVDCHGGDAWVCSTGKPLETEDGLVCNGEWIYDQDLAHVGPGTGPKFLKNLRASQLDDVDPDYLRFINPGDFRVAEKSCGGSDCHQAEVETVPHSTMAHTSGEVTVARYRAGKQATPHGEIGAVDLFDPDKPPDDPCAVESLAQMNPAPLDPASTEGETELTVANAQDQYMVKSCFRCHLNDFGENAFPGDFRSSGCTACHMTYDDDGLSKSDDPWINKQTVPHPIKHQLTKSPPIQQCTHCHYRGGRIGISYQGYRESGGSGLNPTNPGTLGETLHNHPANWYLTDEDLSNDCDETPPDLHFEAGMHCVDCHTKVDVHGDGHLYADTQCAVTTSCESCHGTVRERATLDPERDNFFEEDGVFKLRLRVENKVLEVPQTIDSVTPGAKGYSVLAEQAMGVNERGFSHTDTMECYTCHAAWIPTCYGCHVEVDLTREQKYHTTGALVPGRSSGSRQWVVLNDLALLWNTEGKLAPSMPSERFFMSIFELDQEESERRQQTVAKAVFENKPRTFVHPDGRKMAGFGQRAFNPHTTRRKSQFMACDRCHSSGSAEDPQNEVLMDITHGFGTERFLFEGCDVSNEDDSCGDNDTRVYSFDQLMTRSGEPTVVVGHPDPIESRVLSLEEVERMRAIVAPPNWPYQTSIPAGASTDATWPTNLLCQ